MFHVDQALREAYATPSVEGSASSDFPKELHRGDRTTMFLIYPPATHGICCFYFRQG